MRKKNGRASWFEGVNEGGERFGGDRCGELRRRGFCTALGGNQHRWASLVIGPSVATKPNNGDLATNGLAASLDTKLNTN